MPRWQGWVWPFLFCFFFSLQGQLAALASLEQADRNTDRSWTATSVSQDTAEGWVCVLELQTTFQEEQEHPNLPWE